MKKIVIIILISITLLAIFYFVSKNMANKKDDMQSEIDAQNTNGSGFLQNLTNLYNSITKNELTLQEAIEVSKEISNLFELNNEKSTIQANELKSDLALKGYTYVAYGEVEKIA